MKGARVPGHGTLESAPRGGPVSPYRRGAGHCGTIQRLDVVFHHSFGAELWRNGSDTLLDQLEPAAGNAIEIALVKQWNRFLFQHTVHLFAMVLVLSLYIRVAVYGWNAAAVRAVVAFLPPAIERAEM